MYPILLLLIAVLILTVFAFLKSERLKKLKDLIASLGLFALVWGIIGQVIGLIEAFDAVEMSGGIAIGILANGLKFTFLSSLFGLLVFFISRLCTTILNWRA
jgi:flagellar motor component MotA